MAFRRAGARAGVAFLEGARVTGLRRDGGSWRVDSADGASR